MKRNLKKKTNNQLTGTTGFRSVSNQHFDRVFGNEKKKGVFLLIF